MPQPAAVWGRRNNPISDFIACSAALTTDGASGDPESKQNAQILGPTPATAAKQRGDMRDTGYNADEPGGLCAQ